MSTPGFALSAEWDEANYVGFKAENNAWLHGPQGRHPISYDPNRIRDAEVCNVSREDGSVCRFLKGHVGLHVPCSGEIVAVTGLIVGPPIPEDG